MKVLFVHRSVGKNFIKDGRLREKLNGRHIDFDDYDQNDDIFTLNDLSTTHPQFIFPHNDTKPASYSDIFSDDPVH
ncbi:hypothetical protein KBC31_03620 [Candidatus Saccharibacteria bacterium]|jgi:hypothetical protein|nr:hypothetical protein [Candidatus Saccharibacteria bacterium]